MIKKTNYKLTDDRSNFKPFNYPWAYEAWLKHEQIQDRKSTRLNSSH